MCLALSLQKNEIRIDRVAAPRANEYRSHARARIQLSMNVSSLTTCANISPHESRRAYLARIRILGNESGCASDGDDSPGGGLLGERSEPTLCAPQAKILGDFIAKTPFCNQIFVCSTFQLHLEKSHFEKYRSVIFILLR